MNRLKMRYPLMEEATDASGEVGGGGGGSAASSAPAAQDTAPAAQSILDGDEPKSVQGGGDAPKSEPPKATANLLDDDDAKPGDGTAQDNAGATPDAAPTAEQITEWTKGIKALDMGDGVQWSDELLNEMAPALMGLPKDKQESTIKAYADFQAKQAKIISENADNANQARIKLCRDRFGDDLPKIAGLAKKAGARIFEKHPEIWNALKGTPEFANNPDVIDCLAGMARFFTEDTGRIVPKDGTGGSDGGDVLHRMYGNVKP